jgi:integrase
MASLQSYKGKSKAKTNKRGDTVLDKDGNPVRTAPTLWRLQFMPPDRKRRTLYLGEVGKTGAESIKRHVEAIVANMLTEQPPPDETARWIAKLNDTMYAKLAEVGLVAPRESAKLGPFLAAYVAKRGDVKSATVINWRHTRRNLIAFFGEGRPLREITEGAADDWRRWLITHEKLAENTVNKRCQNAKQFFRHAVRHQLIDRNPFADLKGATKGNPKRFYFLSRADADKILKACPDTQWRLIFALSRYGGLRCPSEHLALRWGDVDFENGRLNVRSPKTEHHTGGDCRIIPLFPELRPLLQAALDELYADPAFDPKETRLSERPVITRYRDASQNLRTTFEKIVKRAGLKPWPKLFQNLRSTRQTELEEDFPSHVVCSWIGNSERVARQHYLQTTDEHFTRASSVGETTHKTTHGMAEMGGIERKAEKQESEETQENHCFPGFLETEPMGVTGLEPVTSAMSTRRSSQLS